MKSNSVESTDNHNVLKMRSIHLLKIKKLDKAFVVILLLYLFLAFFMITRFPKVWMDSSWTTIAPYTLITKGKFANPIVSPKGDGLDEPILSPALTQKILLACVYTVFGFGLIQSRVPSIFAGFFLIIITYYFAKKYYDQTIALLAIVLMASDNVFFVTSRTIRPEIFLALFASAAFFLFLHALESKSLTYFALSGIFMGLSLYTHPNSFLVLLTLLIIFFHQQKFVVMKENVYYITPV
ncbi:MAG: ArnT family glycosyltransferase [Candidatus Hodarchaeota archaeon]